MNKNKRVRFVAGAFIFLNEPIVCLKEQLHLNQFSYRWAIESSLNSV
jgi:hypothetical protein